MSLSLFIARRYLFAKKSHNVINIISLISALGISIGTAALIIILSIYNGFNDIISQIYSRLEADLIIEPAKGKYFSPNTDAFDFIREESISFSQVIEENVFATYDNSNASVQIIGVDSLFEEKTRIKESVIEGEFSLKKGEINQAVVGISLAYNLGLRPHFITPLELYFPAEGRVLSLLNPTASMKKISVFPAGILSVEQNLDKRVVYLPIEVARDLLNLDDQVTRVEINLPSGEDEFDVKNRYTKLLGDSYIVKDRYQQNETIYKMMKYEKIAIYSVLLFIIIIISCNIFGSLSMLVVEKEDDILTLKRIGANDSLISRIFLLEGWLISIFGIIVGLLLGLLFCVLQQKFGLIKMPGNFIVPTYPVIIEVFDVIITIIGVALIGFLVSFVPSRAIKGRVKSH